MAENNSSAPLKTADGAYPALPEPDAWRYTDARGHYRYRGKRAGFATEYQILKPEPLYTAEQMRAYAAQAVEAQAAPAAVAVPCGVCGADEAFTGSCGGGRSNPRALCFERAALAATPALPATEPARAAVAVPPSAYVNAAGITASDKPGTVVRKLDAAFHDAVTFKDATPEMPATGHSSAGDLARAKKVAGPVRDEIQRLAQFADCATRMNARDMHNNMETLADELTKLLATLTEAQAEVQAEPVADEQIKAVFLANGFTIKEGLADLKPYVYQAARALLQLAAPQAQPADAPTAYLQEADQHLLHRFIETTEDDESFDIGKDAVKRLANLGVVESCGFGRYGITMFGYWVHEHYWHQNPSLPLKTNADRDREHRAAMAAAQEGGNAANPKRS